MLMWETDLVQLRSARAWLPWSHISSQMGIGTREGLPCSFVVSNKCLCCWCGKSFSSIVTFALGWVLGSQCSVTIQFAGELVTHVIAWALLAARNGMGSYATLLFKSCCLVYHHENTHRRTRPELEVSPKRELDVLGKLLFHLSLCKILTTCQKVFWQHTLLLLIKGEFS